MTRYDPADINGDPPDLAGRRCEAMIASAYSHKGQLIDPANISWLKFDGAGHRLYFDHGFIFWREDPDPPEDNIDAEQGEWAWRNHDVAAEAGVSGQRLTGYEMIVESPATRVVFTFETGITVTFVNSFVEDVTTVEIHRL